MHAQKPTVIFVPGAWHFPAGFTGERASLENLGYPTEAVTLPSIGAEPPTKTVLDDANRIRTTVEKLVDAGKNVVVVVYSYGGVCGGNEVEGLGYAQRQGAGLDGGVINFVYMSAFGLPTGVSLLDALGGKPLPWMDFQLSSSVFPGVWSLDNIRQGEYVPATTPEGLFYHDMSLDEQARWIAQLSHTSAAIFSGKSTYESYKYMPCTYLLCEDGKAIPLVVQQGIAGSLGSDTTTFRIAASHSSFLSTPDKVVEGIELAAKVGLEKSN